MWERLRQIWMDLLSRSRQQSRERREDKARARFWEELREGEREAEARSGS